MTWLTSFVVGRQRFPHTKNKCWWWLWGNDQRCLGLRQQSTACRLCVCVLNVNFKSEQPNLVIYDFRNSRGMLDERILKVGTSKGLKISWIWNNLMVEQGLPDTTVQLLVIISDQTSSMFDFTNLPHILTRVQPQLDKIRAYNCPYSPSPTHNLAFIKLSLAGSSLSLSRSLARLLARLNLFNFRCRRASLQRWIMQHINNCSSSLVVLVDELSTSGRVT